MEITSLNLALNSAIYQVFPIDIKFSIMSLFLINYFHMEIKIQTQHVELGKEREAFLKEKFEKLTQFAHLIGDESSEIRVELVYQETKKSEDQYTCKLTLFVPHNILRAEAHDATLENAVDEVIVKIKTQIEHYKDKMHHISERKNEA